MTRALAWTAGVLTAVVVVTGVYVTFRYRPDATGFRLGMQRLHGLAGVALAVVVVVGLAAYVWERRPDRRYGLPAFVVVAVMAVGFVVTAGLGQDLAWDQVALRAVVFGELGRFQGVVLDDLPLQFLIVGRDEVSVDDFRRTAWLHLLVLPALLALGTAAVFGWTRRHARPEARDTVTAPDAPTGR